MRSRVVALATAAVALAGVDAYAATTEPSQPAATAEAAKPFATASASIDYAADGRLPLAAIMTRFEQLSAQGTFEREDIYAYPDDPSLVIRGWRTPNSGEALWLVSGIHGEEPAGPNAIARTLPTVLALARAGVPVVVVPLSNPKAYRHNWRYPNTPERDWRKGGGYSVGDAEYLLPDLEAGTKARAKDVSGPETRALTQWVLRTAERYPPRLVLDLHEDELSREGGYIYSQGVQAEHNPVGARIVRLVQDAGIPLRTSGKTRFGETIVDGVISRDDRGGPIRDGSIDELLATAEVIVDGHKRRGPSAGTVIVVETPAFAGSQFERRVAAQSAVVEQLEALWRLSPPRAPPPPR